jgi:glycosyltransferase involved in cell wall biosynthesis
MKITVLLQASSRFIKGGSELQADLIMNELVKAGHEVSCVSDMMGEPGPGLEGVEYIYLKSRGRKFAVWNFVPLMKILKRLDPDIIYQRFRVPYTGLAAWYAKRSHCKMVFNMANVKDPRKNKVPWNRMFAFNFIIEHLGRYGIRNVDEIVAQTHDQRQALRENFGRDCVVIRNGHPVPEPPFEKKNPPIVLWVSNVKPVKRLELFLDLARDLRDTPARFVYVGRPADNKFYSVPEEKLNHSGNVTYLGELPYEETNELIAGASVLVNTSVSEGFPNTFVQAWLRETPVVSLDVDPDRLLQTEGIGYCSGSAEKLAGDVKALLEDTAKRRQMGERARRYAVEHHDITRIGKSYLDLFQRLRGAA